MRKLELGIERSRRTVTWIAMAHIGLALTSLIAVLASSTPAALVLGAPSMVVLLSMAATGRVVRPGVAASIDRRRALEGDELTLRLELAATSASAPRVDIEFAPSEAFTLTSRSRALFSVGANKTSSTEFVGTVNHWGVVGLGSFKVSVRDWFGLTLVATNYRIMTPLRVHVHEEKARSLTDPDRFRRLVGSHQSDERGEGVEIADVRPYQPGDRLQSLNWRISARNDEPWITLRHPDRSTTIVVIVDGFQRSGAVRTDALRRSVRATLGLARLHTNAQDPVGLMLVGGALRWVPPDLGRAHMHRLTDALLEITMTGKRQVVPNRQRLERLIPKDAVVLAVSPLTDSRFEDIIVRLRARGQSLYVIQPITFWPDYVEPRRHGKAFEPRHAWRVHSLRSQLDRQRVSEAGIPVIPWEEDQPIESVLRALRMSRRARRAAL